MRSQRRVALLRGLSGSFSSIERNGGLILLKGLTRVVYDLRIGILVSQEMPAQIQLVELESPAYPLDPSQSEPPQCRVVATAAAAIRIFYIY